MPQGWEARRVSGSAVASPALHPVRRGENPVGAGNSAVVVDLPRCGPMLSPRVPNLVPIPGPRMERETPGQRPRPNYGHPQGTHTVGGAHGELVVSGGRWVLDNDSEVRVLETLRGACGERPQCSGMPEARDRQAVQAADRLDLDGRPVRADRLWRSACCRLATLASSISLSPSEARPRAPST